MQVIEQASLLQPGQRPVCVAIGMFDGVHLGHQQVLRKTAQDAHEHRGTSVAITFDEHPNTVVAPDRVPPSIYPLAQRLRFIGSVGIETVLLIHFDEAFSRQSGRAFIESLVRDFGRVHSLYVGSNFTFGHHRSGDVALLQALAPELGFAVHPVTPTLFQGKPISSTRIRAAIQGGNLALAREMMGRPYAIAAPVIQGQRLGQKLGFPTANLNVKGLALPPNGVYAGRARTRQGAFAAAANVGYRPTVNTAGRALSLEVHLIEFSGDLYGQEIEFEFRDKLRDEQKFASLEALQEQIARDVAAIQARTGERD